MNHELKTVTLLLGRGHNFFPSFVCRWLFPSSIVWESIPLPFFWSVQISQRLYWGSGTVGSCEFFNCCFPMMAWLYFPLFWWYRLKYWWELLCDGLTMFSPINAWIAIWLLACNGFFLRLHWSGEWGPKVLDKTGGLRTTQTELLSWISSPQPLNSTRREIRVWGTVLQRKHWFPCVGCVWVF